MARAEKRPAVDAGAMGRRVMTRDKDALDPGFEQFEQFLKEWSRRDFLRRTGGAAAYMAFLAGGAEFLAACATGPATTPSVKAVKGGHIVEGNSTDIRNFNTVPVSDVYSATVNGLLFDSLVQVDGKGNVIPCLAKELPKLSSDSLTYTFTLRQDVKWTDGSPL